MVQDTLALILAGGHGTRLGALTARCAKPALPFGGSLRVIDFALGNCLHSGVRRVAVLTQYRAQRLIRHLVQGYVERGAGRGMTVEIVPAQQQLDQSWYRGTADAVFQNLELLEESGARRVLVLAGDHVYKMNYARMLEQHRRQGADLTVACMEVPRAQAGAFGVMAADAQGLVTAFTEKPAHPQAVPGRDDLALVSMGIYIFDLPALVQALRHDASDDGSCHDFGHSLLPGLLGECRVVAHPFSGSCVRAVGAPVYWRDIGTPDVYWQAHMDLTSRDPPLDLFDPTWPILGAPQALAATRIEGERRGGERDTGARVRESLIAGGCVIQAARIARSVLSSGARVADGCDVDESLLMPRCSLGRGSVLRRAIVDEGCVVPPGTRVGLDAEDDARRFTVTPQGVVLVTAERLGGGA